MAAVNSQKEEEEEAGIGIEKGAEQARSAGGSEEKGKNSSDPWRLESPQPIRETEVDNAVKFLSNAKVRSSPIVHRRSFLESKGLTREEIDEAFRRVPDPPSSDHAGTTLQAAKDIQAPVSTLQAVTPVQQQQAGIGPSVQPQGPKGASWRQRLLAIGFLATAGACTGVITNAYLIPKFKEWVRSIVLDQGSNVNSKPSISTQEPQVSEATTAAAAAAAAASEVAAAIQELAHARAKGPEGQQLSSIIKALETQTQELKSAMAGMKDILHASDTISHPRSESLPGHRTDVWRTPEMPRPTGMLGDRSFAAVVNSLPTPPEQIDPQQDE